jgi:hypothetical protein
MADSTNLSLLSGTKGTDEAMAAGCLARIQIPDVLGIPTPWRLEGMEMKVILRGYGVGMNRQQRFAARGQAADTVRTRGTGKRPSSPRESFCNPRPA